MALKFMAEKESGSLTSAREICENFGAPFDTMAKVMQSLNNQGVLSSVKGIKGGYTLEKDLADLTFNEVELIIEGKEKYSICQNSKKTCDLYSVCNIKGPVEKLNEHIVSYLSELTLDKLFFEDTKESNIQMETSTSLMGRTNE